MTHRSDRLLRLYRRMYLIRRFEEAALAQSARGNVHGALHLSVGQEAVAVGACDGLTDEDLVASTHRGHGHCLAKGVPAAELLAELFGRTNGSCAGRGGSMHIADLERGVIGCNGVVSANLAITAGVAGALKRRGGNHVTICFFGDGASNRGPFLEALNLAAIWQLPVLYVCENNGYGQYTPFSKVSKVPEILPRAEALGVTGATCDGMDVEDVTRTAAVLIERVRATSEPALLEAGTYRYHGHGLGDTNYYRTAEEIEEARGRDPLDRTRDRLAGLGVPDDVVKELEGGVESELDAAVAFADGGARPRGEDVGEHVYSPAMAGRIRELGWTVIDGYAH